MKDRDKFGVIRDELARLRPTLSGFVRNHNAKARAVTIEAPALTSGATYNGIDLVEFMTPDQRAGQGEVEELFSRLVFQRLAPDLLDKAPDWAPVGPRVERFVDGRLDRLLFWNGRRPGNTLEIAPGTVMVNNRFGVRDGVVHCQYDTYLPDRTLRLGTLSEPFSLVSKDQSFAILYGRATPEDRVFLAAARVAYPYGFENLAPWAYGRAEGDLREQVTKILMEADRPMGRLYDLLVPAVMRKRVFYRTIGGPDTWATATPKPVRERVFMKLVAAGII